MRNTYWSSNPSSWTSIFATKEAVIWS
jgi:hypothetical protein